MVEPIVVLTTAIAPTATTGITTLRARYRKNHRLALRRRLTTSIQVIVGVVPGLNFHGTGSPSLNVLVNRTRASAGFVHAPRNKWICTHQEGVSLRENGFMPKQICTRNALERKQHHSAHPVLTDNEGTGSIRIQSIAQA